ncbi:conserved hypothetical protein [Vibrio crassostreae]|nr:conserved hypothetical protein [Vibrio crassostreae]CAK2518374.1 conserved hypothetical protein [Vibrio crassostreae]CAK3030316.1 conserved hypothetical protein [Vibrio crassostreae]CAK3638340.1 conserved hypothetical protein [Vibrio crassostreae]CAK3727420.1 conserved hypothetical protein [Vibrio crassostreae]
MYLSFDHSSGGETGHSIANSCAEEILCGIFNVYSGDNAAVVSFLLAIELTVNQFR